MRCSLPGGHGARVVWDTTFRSYRCTGCGHRYLGLPWATRRMMPWWWLRELRGRRWARQQGGALAMRLRARRD
jgi:hypothetical protein